MMHCLHPKLCLHHFIILHFQIHHLLHKVAIYENVNFHCNVNTLFWNWQPDSLEEQS